MHSEVKQTEKLEFGERKVYCRVKEGEGVAHALKTPNSPKGFRKAFLKAR